MMLKKFVALSVAQLFPGIDRKSRGRHPQWGGVCSKLPKSREYVAAPSNTVAQRRVVRYPCGNGSTLHARAGSASSEDRHHRRHRRRTAGEKSRVASFL